MRGMLLALRTALGARRARVFVALLLAAFLLQVTVTRSHFHFGAVDASVAQAGVEHDAGAPSKPQKAPSGHDESHCPLWHASGICGTADMALASTFAPPISSHTRAQFDPRVIFPERFVASWRSRAPPSV
jgi:hypothetical protein